MSGGNKKTLGLVKSKEMLKAIHQAIGDEELISAFKAE